MNLIAILLALTTVATVDAFLFDFQEQIFVVRNSRNNGLKKVKNSSPHLGPKM